jgi:hypothetical protein
MFVPTRKGQIYMTEACRQRAYRERRSKATEPTIQPDLLVMAIRRAFAAQMRNRAVTHERRRHPRRKK